MISIWLLFMTMMATWTCGLDNEATVPSEHLPGAPDANVLGRSSWTLLHSVTMAYPTTPTLEQRRVMHNFFFTFAQVYPCPVCAKHFQEVLTREPPNTESKATLAKWLCRVHNIVNERLKKPIFPCEMVFKRWDAPAS